MNLTLEIKIILIANAIVFINYITFFIWRAILRKIDRSYDSFNLKFLDKFGDYGVFSRELIMATIITNFIYIIITK